MIKLKNILAEERGPCWKGYKQVGMKDKGGKEVPNCVPESIVKEATTSSEPGEWVAYLSMPRGKKLLKTFNTARGAKQFLSKNVDKLLSGSNVESVGLMTKKQWDTTESKYAIEGITEATFSVNAKNPYEFTNGAYAVLNRYLQTEPLGVRGKKELQNIVKSLEYMRKYFYSNMTESNCDDDVNELGGRIPKLYLKIEAVKKEIDRLIAERNSKYSGEYAKKFNAETDPKKREQLKQPILAISQKITKLQANLADMYEKEEKYYANMGKDDELDPNFA